MNTYSDERLSRNLLNLNPAIWRQCPEYPEYATSVFGELFDLVRNRIARLRPKTSGYVAATVRSDGVFKTTSLHRLVALTWCDPPENWRELQVNHKDGVKDNNHKDNLEWCTAKINVRHAFESGLHNSKIEVIVMDYVGKTMSIYSDLVQAAKATNLKPCTIRSHLIRDSHPKIISGYGFVKLIDYSEDNCFPDLNMDEINNSISKHKSISERSIKRKRNTNYTVKNYMTNEEIVCWNYRDIQEITNFSQTKICDYIYAHSLWPMHGFSIKPSSDLRPFPELTQQELEVNLKQINRRSGGYSVEDIHSGAVKLLPTAYEVSQYLTNSPHAIQSTISRQLKSKPEFIYMGRFVIKKMPNRANLN